jgi:hypothetical protein
VDEKLMSLSFSVEANKGVYALLLGSGISYSAGIPTGWGVLKELCRRIMLLDGAEEQDEIKWYEEKFGKAPLYDEVIGMLAKTSSERNGLLKEFFEPTEEDLEENKKLPTKAHRAIAELVKQGYIKVIVTTNFDRLIEQALDELNVQYQTLYHDSDIEGMKPLTHADCTVLKINGDYRDTRFKNITDELESYSEPLTDILKRIFDDYGLIISGWSAEWDTALRDTIKSVKGRRYSWYWHSFSSEINDKAKELVNFRDATVLVNTKGADDLFKELKDNVLNISTLKKSNIESIQLQVQKAKKYLSNRKEIELRELVTEETKRISEFMLKQDYSGPLDKEKLVLYIEKIKEVAKPLALIISIVAFYSKTKEDEELLKETLERLTSLNSGNGDTLLLSGQILPLQIILYSIGISLVKGRKYTLLNKVFINPKVRDKFENRLTFLEYTAPHRGLYSLFDKFYLPQTYYQSMEMYMFELQKIIFLENSLAIDEREFHISYDIFEFCRCIKSRFLNDNHYYSGKFGYQHDRKHIELLLKDGANDENWNLLVLCDNSKQKFLESLKSLVSDLNSQQNYHRYSGRGLVEAYLDVK